MKSAISAQFTRHIDVRAREVTRFPRVVNHSIDGLYLYLHFHHPIVYLRYYIYDVFTTYIICMVIHVVLYIYVTEAHSVHAGAKHAIKSQFDTYTLAQARTR